MAYLMDENAMRICGESMNASPSLHTMLMPGSVRPRPWHPERELPYIAKDDDQPFFLGGGNFGTVKKAPVGGGALREIVGEFIIPYRLLTT